MRFRVFAGGGAVLCLALVGCGTPPPCQIIPKQIELARYDREQVQQQLDQKKSEVLTSQKNLELSRTRLQQMQQEKDDLQKTLSEQAADSAAAGRKK